MGKTVVVVEDEETTANIVRVALEALGCEVHTASDGRTGLELVRKLRPALAMLDIMMPRMNGYEVCARIQTDPALKGTKIIMVTGIAEGEGDVEEAQWRERLEVADFIAKPFHVDDLQARVRKALGLD